MELLLTEPLLAANLHLVLILAYLCNRFIDMNLGSCSNFPIPVDAVRAYTSEITTNKIGINLNISFTVGTFVAMTTSKKIGANGLFFVKRNNDMLASYPLNSPTGNLVVSFNTSLTTGDTLYFHSNMGPVLDTDTFTTFIDIYNTKTGNLVASSKSDYGNVQGGKNWTYLYYTKESGYVGLTFSGGWQVRKILMFFFE